MMGTVAVTDDGTLPPAGDPAAGKTVFESAGCGSCHTLADAGATGTTGPNLDQHVAIMGTGGIASVIRRGRLGMPAFGDRLSETEILNVASYLRLFAGDHHACETSSGSSAVGHAQHCF
jgi:mono/diheme cytochrome c family protein